MPLGRPGDGLRDSFHDLTIAHLNHELARTILCCTCNKQLSRWRRGSWRGALKRSSPDRHFKSVRASASESIWLTANPAWALGIDSTTGTLEAGKAADVVVWSGDPFSVYSTVEQVYNDGWLVFDRGDRQHRPETDFNLGTSAPGVGR